jgi:hypothetical protein
MIEVGARTAAGSIRWAAAARMHTAIPRPAFAPPPHRRQAEHRGARIGGGN